MEREGVRVARSYMVYKGERMTSIAEIEWVRESVSE